MAKSKIEWTEYSWNPVTGCTPISEGCQNCYAKRMAKRLAGRCGYPEEEPFKVTLHEDKLREPFQWTKSKRRVFTCSMSDLFHEDVPDRFIIDVFQVMADCPQHTFIVLTKRPRRMNEIVTSSKMRASLEFITDKFPLFNVWIGVTAENQARADERIPILLQIPAAVRFVSVEPMLGPVDLTKINQSNNTWINALTGNWTGYHPYGGAWTVNNSYPRLDWVICGGETGPGARPMNPDWARSLRDQCQAAGVPFFFKQHGEWLHETQGIDFHEGHRYYVWPDESMSFRVGKKAAGRILDGRTWDEMPEI